MSAWGDCGTWSGAGLRREVFFFSSGGVELYGSLFAAAELSRPWGVVACGSWGTEADRTDPLVRSVVLAMARSGGAGLTFHYPGYGDSYGDLATVDLPTLGQATADAVAEASRRCTGFAWVLAGFMLGASVACLAHCSASARHLLLVQPALRPGAYFQRLAKRRQPLAPGPTPREMMEAGTTPGMAYGYPVPDRILRDPETADRSVVMALDAFDGGGAVLRQPSREEQDPMPPRFDQIEVDGTWRFGSQDHPQLSAAATAWLDERTGGGEA